MSTRHCSVNCMETDLFFWYRIGRLLDTRIFSKVTHNWNKDCDCVIHTSQHSMYVKLTHWRGSVIQTTMWLCGHTSPRRLWNQTHLLMILWSWTQLVIMPRVWRTLSYWQWRVLLLDCRTLVRSVVRSSFLFSLFCFVL